MRLNNKMAQLEVIKEHLHKMFDYPDRLEAQEVTIQNVVARRQKRGLKSNTNHLEAA